MAASYVDKTLRHTPSMRIRYDIFTLGAFAKIYNSSVVSTYLHCNLSDGALDNVNFSASKEKYFKFILEREAFDVGSPSPNGRAYTIHISHLP